MRTMLVAALATLGIFGGSAAAHADETVVVPGTSFPSGSTYLTYFGCTDLYHADTRGPEVRVRQDDGAPSGRRATELRMPGTGTASGPVSLVGSVAAATSSVAVDATAGSQGVAYVWYVSSELESGEVWAGRADLSAAASGWQQVDATAATYTWARLDAATGEVLEEPDDATITDFTTAHGDGPGYLLSGFGCDGQRFSIDDLRVGTPGTVTTYDLEGWSVTTSISASREVVAPGEELRIVGKAVDPWTRVMGAPMVLEARPRGAAGFEPVTQPVAAGADGSVVATVAPQVTTDYRWVFAETAYADTSRSDKLRVRVEQPEAGDPPPETQTPALPAPSMPEVTAPQGGTSSQGSAASGSTTAGSSQPASEPATPEPSVPPVPTPTDPTPTEPAPTEPPPADQTTTEPPPAEATTAPQAEVQPAG